MTVKELREKLATLPDDYIVVAQVNNRAFNSLPGTVYSAAAACMCENPGYAVWSETGFAGNDKSHWHNVVVLR